MNHKQLKRNYIKLYEQMMKYIWPIETVELLAELEVAVCNVFPIMSDVRTKFQRLRNSIISDIKEDKDMEKVFDTFSNATDEDVTFSNIQFVESK